MSRFEQLREELVRIKQEAAQREAAEKAAQQIEEEERERKRKEEKETRQLVEYNWTLAKNKILDELNEINTNVFSGQAKVTGWRTRTVEHKHIGQRFDRVDDNGNTYYEGFIYFHHETIEVAKLSIPNIGSIFLFRINDSPGEINIHSGATDHNYGCSRCSGLTSIDLSKQFPEITEEIETTVFQKITSLHQNSLLK